MSERRTFTIGETLWTRRFDAPCRWGASSDEYVDLYYDRSMTAALADAHCAALAEIERLKAEVLRLETTGDGKRDGDKDWHAGMPWHMEDPE